METDIDTRNDFFLGTTGHELGAMLPVRITSREQAFRTAAWIALMGYSLPSENPNGPHVEFEDVKKAIEST